MVSYNHMSLVHIITCVTIMIRQDMERSVRVGTGLKVNPEPLPLAVPVFHLLGVWPLTLSFAHLAGCVSPAGTAQTLELSRERLPGRHIHTLLLRVCGCSCSFCPREDLYSSYHQCARLSPLDHCIAPGEKNKSDSIEKKALNTA